MAAPSSISDLINKTTGGGSGTPEFIWAFLNRQTAAGVAFTVPQAIPYSSWTSPNTPSGTGAAPGATPRSPGRTTAGALGQVDPTGGRKKWLVGLHSTGAFSTAYGILFVADRLADVSGLSGTSTSLVTFSPAMTVSRYTGTEAVGNQLYVEIYTAVGSTARTLTVNYTNENGVSKTTSVQVGGTASFRSQLLFRPVPLVQGDRGIRSVESAQLSGSTLTAGNFGLTIARPLTSLYLGSAGPGGAPADILTNFGGPIEIKTDACLFFWGWSTLATANFTDIGLQFVES